MQPYDLTFHYRPGKEIPVADTLSRLHLPDVDKEAESEGELAIHTFFKQIPIIEKRMEHIRQESLQDEELSILIQVIENGWPENRKDAPVSTTPYWNYRDELVVNNGLILKGERVVYQS